MSFAHSLSGSAHGIDALSKSAVTRVQRRACPVEHVCSVGMRSHERGSDDSVSRTRGALFTSWNNAIDSSRRVQCRATNTYTVEMIHDGVKHVLQVPEDETILSVALEENLDVPHDCKLGVCMTCPAKLVKGIVDQSGGMLSDDVIDEGYALMCVAYPQSDCTISTIPEEELLRIQLATAND